MTPSELKQLIESDAPAKSAASADDWLTVAGRCGVIAPPVRLPVACSLVRRVASLSGVYGAIRLAARETSEAPAGVKGVCITVADWLATQETLDLDLPEVRAMAAALVAAGICTQEQLDALTSLGDTPQTFTPLECRVAVKGK